MVNIKFLIFDWGNTVMRDLGLPGPMKQWERIENVPGIDTVLKELGRNHILVIATSAAYSNTEDMKEALALGGLLKYFSHFFSSYDLGTSKPDPEFFRTIIYRLGCQASQALSVGDKYPNDVVAAKRAGLSAIWFDERQSNAESPLADGVITHMHELPGIIKSLTFPDKG